MKWTPTGASFSPTNNREKSAVDCAESIPEMKFGAKNFHKTFAVVSLGFTLLGFGVVPCPVQAASNNTSVKRDAASNQFGRAEELRETLNAKPAEKRTLAEYKQVVNSYRRVYMITPHSAQVPEALMAVGELDSEMGDRFGRSYYQAAVDSYQFLIREYPGSKYVPDAMLRVAGLQKDQLGDPTAATKSYQDFLKKYPHSQKKREVQESLAELALMKNAETGQLDARTATSAPVNAPPAAKPKAPEVAATRTVAPAPTPATVPVSEESVETPKLTGKSGGESARAGEVPHIKKIKTNVTPGSTEVVIELEDSVQYASGRIASPDRIYFDLHAAKLSPNVAHGNVAVSGELLTNVRVAQNQSGVVRVVLDVNGVQDYAATLVKKPTRLVIELYGSSVPAKQDPVETSGVVSTSKSRAKAVDTVVASQMASAEAADLTVTPEKTEKPPTSAGAKEVPAPFGTPTGATSPTTSASTNTKKDPASGTLVRAKNGKGSKPDLIQQTPIPQLTRDGQSTLTRALGLKIGRIVIDAGHGGHDTGTIGPTGLMEKDLCLDVALRLGKLIQQKLPDTEIVYTRSDDTFIPLEERTHIANETKADLVRFHSREFESRPCGARRGNLLSKSEGFAGSNGSGGAGKRGLPGQHPRPGRCGEEDRAHGKD